SSDLDDPYPTRTVGASECALLKLCYSPTSFDLWTSRPTVCSRRAVPMLREPPQFCQYADGPCDQNFETESLTRGLILFPSDPIQIASTMEAAAQALKLQDSGRTWRTWRDL